MPFSLKDPSVCVFFFILFTAQCWWAAFKHGWYSSWQFTIK